KPFNIILNKGDAYLVEGSYHDVTNDLTGSLIESDQPVAVFSGHHRTAIPDTAVNIDGSPSRDHCVEQLPPVSAWGDSALVVPYATSALPDLVRIVCSEDGTQLTINGTPVPRTFNAGDFYEITHLQGVTSIQASRPIEVGQFMHTSLGGLNDPRIAAYGDPALALVYPVEQFTNAYTIISIINADAYTGNFVNIVADQTALGSMMIDGVPINTSEFTNIPNSRFAYAQHRVVQGTHNLTCNKPFGVTVYGLGGVDSYSYVGGTLLKTITPLKTVGLTIDFGDRVISGTDVTGGPNNYPYTPTDHFDTTVVLQNISQDSVNIYSFPRRVGDTDRFFVDTTSNGSSMNLVNGEPQTGGPPGLPLSIPPLGSASFTIEFWPHQANRRMHTQITANTDHLRAYVVDVYGRGVTDNMGVFADTTKSITIDTIDFGTFTNTPPIADSEVFVGNAGTAPMSVNVVVTNHSNAFDMSGIGYAGAPVTVPFIIAQPPSGAARIGLQFNPTGLLKGKYVDSLIVTSKSSTHIVILIGHVDIINALAPAVDSVRWGTMLVCNDSTFNIQYTNTNDVPITVTNASIVGLNATDFAIASPIPLVIPPGTTTTLQVEFNPTAKGPRTAQAIVSFDLPRAGDGFGPSDTIALAGTGDKPLLAFAAPRNVKSYFLDSSFLMPIFAITPLDPFAPQGYTIYVQHDSVNLVLADVVNAGTLTPNGYFTILRGVNPNGEPNGCDTIVFQQAGEGSKNAANKIKGGGPGSTTPLIYLQFKPQLNGQGNTNAPMLTVNNSPLTFLKDFPIDYQILLTDPQILSQCSDRICDSGLATVSGACDSIELTNAPSIPLAAMLGIPTPNPAGAINQAGGGDNLAIDIPYDLPITTDSNAVFQIAIYDQAGTKRATIAQGDAKPGRYHAALQTSGLQQGTYFVVMTCGSYMRARNIVIVK
ncbi:MAG TPA: choice-of-anchor D domain-containing protein, partial [Candidatus Kapabacteria bacterium]